jgi:hypothetical protein
MKKYLLLSILIGSLFEITPAFAAGTFTYLDSGTYASALVGVSYKTFINFIYSGTYYPGVSIVGNTLPAGLGLGQIRSGANGVDSIPLTGTPTEAGNYSFTLLLTDNNGAVLTKEVNITIESKSLYSISTDTLADVVVGKPYDQEIDFHYYGNAPVPSFDGLPNGSGCYHSDTMTDIEGTTIPSGKGATHLYCTIQKEGHYTITFHLSLGSNQVSKTFVLSTRSQFSNPTTPQNTDQVPAEVTNNSPVPLKLDKPKVEIKVKKDLKTTVQIPQKDPVAKPVISPANETKPNLEKPVQKKSIWHKFVGLFGF